MTRLEKLGEIDLNTYTGKGDKQLRLCLRELLRCLIEDELQGQKLLDEQRKLTERADKL